MHTGGSACIQTHLISDFIVNELNCHFAICLLSVTHNGFWLLGMCEDECMSFILTHPQKALDWMESRLQSSVPSTVQGLSLGFGLAIRG